MEKSAKSVSEILSAIRNLLADPARWTKGSFARDTDGNAVAAVSRDACSWCLSGAHQRIGRTARAGWFVSAAIVQRYRADERAGGLCGFVSFNDDPSTTHADVLAVLDRAIELAKAEEAP